MPEKLNYADKQMLYLPSSNRCSVASRPPKVHYAGASGCPRLYLSWLTPMHCGLMCLPDWSWLHLSTKHIPRSCKAKHNRPSQCEDTDMSQSSENISWPPHQCPPTELNNWNIAIWHLRPLPHVIHPLSGVHYSRGLPSDLLMVFLVSSHISLSIVINLNVAN